MNCATPDRETGSPKSGIGDYSRHLAGDAIYGDDFSQEQLNEWYQDEKDAYSRLVGPDRKTYRYVYHSLNRKHGFSLIGERRFRTVLAFGAAYGHELIPVLGQIERLTIVDSSEAFRGNSIGGVPVTYHLARPDGRLTFPDGMFDLITCFGVLHHIPNVSYVFSELVRCLSGDGYLLLREPIISMGDWRRPRVGLSPHERGIPLSEFRRLISRSTLDVVNEALCQFGGLARAAHMLRCVPYNSGIWVSLDAVLCRLFSRRTDYHTMRPWRRFRPSSVFYVLRKPA